MIAALGVLAVGAGQIAMEHRHSGHQTKISSENHGGHSKTLSNPDFGALTTVVGGPAFPTMSDLRLLPSRRTWKTYTGRHELSPSDYWDNLLKRDVEDEFLVSRIARLTTLEKSALNELLKELLPQLNSWRVELSRNEFFILYETSGGAQHSADLFGDGMASLFRVALALFDSGPNQIVVIDEPELSLHPQAQKQLAAVLSRFAIDRQVIITTHSPYFVRWCDLAAGAKIYRLNQERQGISIGQLQADTVANLQNLIADWQKPNLLDEVAREVFFADEVIFFEGQEDVGLVRKFTEDKKLSPVAAFGYGAGGFGNIKYFLQMARDLGIPAGAIYDGDHADAAGEARREFPEFFIEVLPVADIRDKPVRDEHGRDTEVIAKAGIFDRAGVCKPQYEPGVA